jgi:hypothetical protein
MKNLLVETQNFKPIQTLTEANHSKRGNPIVGGVMATAEVKNGNGRYYSKALWNREVNKYQTLIDENRALGELDHPDSQVVNLKNSSHNVTKLYWDGDNLMGFIEILPTPSGNILKALIENGITVGVSSRGMGSLEQRGDLLEVQDDFELLCWDFVSTPSNPGSFMHTIKEGKEITLNTYKEAHNIVREILCSKGQCPIL